MIWILYDSTKYCCLCLDQWLPCLPTIKNIGNIWRIGFKRHLHTHNEICASHCSFYINQFWYQGMHLNNNLTVFCFFFFSHQNPPALHISWCQGFWKPAEMVKSGFCKKKKKNDTMTHSFDTFTENDLQRNLSLCSHLWWKDPVTFHLIESSWCDWTCNGELH